MSTPEHHPQAPGRRHRPAPGPLRILAAALCLTLAFTSVVPAFALAREADSEGEGGAAPGTIPGLEGPELEPGGEETALGEVAVGVGEEAEEEALPPEAELPPVSEVPAPETTPEVPPAEPPPAPEPSLAEAPPPPAPTPPPVYEEEPGPSYEPAAPSAGVIENEALSAPATAPDSNQPRSARGGSPAAAVPTPDETVDPEPVLPPEPEPVAAQPATPAEPREAAGSLQGHSSHTVRAGECLWSIAEAVLPAGASEAQIAAEVSRLWRLNAGRIGTGDPGLILVGTVLRLH